MKDRQYYKRMITYLEELERSSLAEPLDRQVFHDTTEAVKALHKVWLRSRRQRHFIITVFTLVLLGLLIWLCMHIYCLFLI